MCFVAHGMLSDSSRSHDKFAHRLVTEIGNILSYSVPVQVLQ